MSQSLTAAPTSQSSVTAPAAAPVGASPAASLPGGRVVPVVLSGGVGTRLWPLSREGYPKQFWPLTSERSMLQETLARAVGPGFSPPMVVCAEAHRFLVAEQMRDAVAGAPGNGGGNGGSNGAGNGLAGGRIVLEPAARNSAPAIAAAALLAAEEDPHALLWVMAADAAIADLPALHAALARAVPAARAGHVVAFGMKPTAPETGFGYIEAGTPLDAAAGGGAGGAAGVSAIASFVEKPDAARAAAFLAGGRHLWNAGMFLAPAATLLAELERLQPELVAAVRAAVEGATRDLDFVRLGARFAEAPSISIDYAVMEHTPHAAVVPADLGWSDVGSWDALWAASPRDSRGNATHGPVELLDATNCLVRSEGILTAVIGLEDVVVVTTEDAVLALPRGRSQDVKALVDQLRAARRPQATQHRRMYRPWGHYEGLIQGERFQVKKILVRPGEKLSLQKHFHRAEHWVVVNGTAIVERDAERILLRENESVYLPLGCVHRMENPGMIPLTLIEVQSGSYLGEDDIVRFEDTYGQV